MAKINHNNHLDLIKDIVLDAKERGITCLFTDKDGYNGSSLNVNGKELLNFGTCGYLGIEFDERLVNRSIEYTKKFGTQFSISRTYMTSEINGQLESKLGELFGYPVIVQSSTTISHISAIPSLVSYKDCIILDQQVHMSVQTAAQVARQKGAEITMIRHNNMEMLERQIKTCGEKYEKIWYLIDGVYSMFGDVAPFDEIKQLMDKYPRLNLYIDDAHGMGWYGKNGTGYAFDAIGLNERIILSTTLAKGFGAVGGILVLPNQETHTKLRSFGGPLTFSHPLPPATIGAALGMIDICLSDDIYTIQDELREKMDYCNELLDQSGLPVISNPLTPIYFIGMGQPKTGFEMVKKLLEDGFYTSIAVFPAVSIKNTGVRFTITRHQTKKDIKALVDCISYHFPRVLKAENKTIESIHRAFKIGKLKAPIDRQMKPEVVKVVGNYEVEYANDIKDFDAVEWDSLMGNFGCFDANGLATQQNIFTNNPLKENNFSFHYFLIRDHKTKEPLLTTFFTYGLHKDDMFEPEGISYQIEQKRKQDPYYLTSEILMMGSFLTEGQHLYFNENRKDWKQFYTLFLNEVNQLSEKLNAGGVMFRDMNGGDKALQTFMLEEGFAKTNMPDTNIVNLTWDNFETYFNSVSGKRRKKLRNEVLAFEDEFIVKFKDRIEAEETEIVYQLFNNVKKNNLAVNMFDYPISFIEKMSNDPNWEFMLLYLKSNPVQPVAVGCCYKTAECYCPMLAGMNYEFQGSHELYKQLLYQIMIRGMELKMKKIYWGFTADETKRKFGAHQEKRVAFIQIKDHFNMELIGSMTATIIS